MGWATTTTRTGDERSPIADYTRLDLTLRTTNGKNKWNVAATVRNFFGADVREPSLIKGGIPNDFPMAPRTVYLQASYKF